MIAPDPPPDEAARIASLDRLELLDSPPEERFDRITRLARRLFDVPIALVSLVDANRQWFKSRQGVDVSETPREISFCGHAILDREVLVVPDAEADGRFSDNPLVTDAPHIRFYAGCPIAAPDGQRVGTVCLIDQKPRDLGEEDLVVLRDLAAMVEREFVALELAAMDELTGLFNRRGFLAVANQALALCHRVDKPASLLFLDLDRFKQINDTLGHAVGDQALIEFAEVLRSTFRDSDGVARLGGDEFCVLLTGTSGEEMKRPLAALQEQIAALNEQPGRRYELAASIGVVPWEPSRHEGIADLLRAADERMYENKRSRREQRDG